MDCATSQWKLYIRHKIDDCRLVCFSTEATVTFSYTLTLLLGIRSILQGEWEYEDSTSSTLDLVSTLLRLIHARHCVWMSPLHLAPWHMVCHPNESVRLSTHAADPKYEKAATDFMQKTAWEHDQVSNVLRHLDRSAWKKSNQLKP